MKNTLPIIDTSRDSNPSQDQAHLIFKDPLVVIDFLERALGNLKNSIAKMKATVTCIELRNEILWNEFGVKEVDVVSMPHKQLILTENDPLIILDHLERSIGYLNMPGARVQAWLSCMTIRSTIMWYEYKKDTPQWAYKISKAPGT